MTKGQLLSTQIQTQCTGEHSVLPVDACESCTMLSAVAPTSIRPGRSKTPLSVTLVIDTSKSMKGHKWEVTARAVTQAIDMLCEEDLFAIVTYSAQASVLMESTIATPDTKQQARNALKEVKLSRGTNLGAGLLMGLRLEMDAATAEKEYAQSTDGSCPPHYRMHAVLLCTDGHPTEGLRTRADILAAQQSVLHPGSTPPQNNKARRVLAPVHTHCIPVSQWPSAKPATRTVWPTAAEWRCTEPSTASKPFVKVITFGFGEDHNPYLLGDIATAAGGSYFFVRSPHDVAPAVTDSLGGLMTVYASNITIRISPRHGAVLAGVLSGFPQRREGGDICVHVPDMYLQEHKDLLVDFRLPARSDGICVSDDVDSSDRTGCGCFQTRGPQVKPGNGKGTKKSCSQKADVYRTASVRTDRHLVDASDISEQTLCEEYSGEMFDVSGALYGASRRSPRTTKPLSPSKGSSRAECMTEVAKVTTRFTEVLSGVQRQVGSRITVWRAAGDSQLAAHPHNPDVTATRLRLQAAIDMHTALRLADDDELAAARGLIGDMLDQVHAWLKEHADTSGRSGASHRRQKTQQSRLQRIHSREASAEAAGTMHELAADLESVAAGFRSREDYQRVGQKHLYMVSQIHASQRSTATGFSSIRQHSSVPSAPVSRTRKGDGCAELRKGKAQTRAQPSRPNKRPHRSSAASQVECVWTTTTSDTYMEVDAEATRRFSRLEATSERVHKLLEASGSTWQPPVRPEDLGDEMEEEYTGASSMLPPDCAFITALGNSFDHALPCADDEVEDILDVHDHKHPPPSVAYGATAELQARVAGESDVLGQLDIELPDGKRVNEGLSLNVGADQDLEAVASQSQRPRKKTVCRKRALPSQPERQAVLVEQSLQALEGMML